MDGVCQVLLLCFLSLERYCSEKLYILIMQNTSLDPGKHYWSIRLAESSNNFSSGSKINPHQFELVHATGYSDSEDDSSESETTGKLHWELGNDRLMRVRENACPCLAE